MYSCATPKEKADAIVHHAVVYTVDNEFSVQQAFAVKDGKFLAVGSNEEILGAFQSDTMIDAMGNPVYPGFYDAHCHFYGYGTNLIKRVDLVGTGSFEEIVERLKAHHQQFPTDWIEGRGWDQNDWVVKEFPTRQLLDKAFPDNPVFLIRVDGHAAVVNSAAMKRAGIDRETKVMGGEVVLAGREPSGLLIDNAMDLVQAKIPEEDDEFSGKALLMAQENCFAVGLTSVSDAGLDKGTVLLIDRMQQEGRLKMRIYAMLSPTDGNISHFVKNGPYETDRLTVRSIKLYADGALGSRGARMIEPYDDDPGNTGLFMYPPDYYNTLCSLAYASNYQVNTHAIGDGGNRFVLDTYSRFLEAGNDRRWRIEHAQIVHPDDFSRFGRYGVIPSVQPTHATSDMYWAAERVGEDRVKGGYAFRQLMEQNGWIPLGTDFPVEDINPIYTFYAVVARKDRMGWPDAGFQMENALTREEALRGMTLWAAKSSFEEGKKGSIEPGKYADFVVLDRDIMMVGMEEVLDAKVVSTFIGGEEVYSGK